MTSTSNKYELPAQADRHDYIQRNFDEIARKYDTFNDLITFGFHRLWKKHIIKLSGAMHIQKPVILDLCCGSGDVSLMFARQKLTAAKIHSLDFSTEMLKVLGARINKAEKSGKLVTKPLIHQGDAADLGKFPSNSIDAVTISFGLRNVQKRTACLNEVLRVLKTNGRLIILDVGEVRPAFFAFFHKIFFEKIVPIIGNIVHGKKHEMYAYLPASAKIYPDQDRLLRELEMLGYQNVKYETRFLGSAAIHLANK